MTAPASRRPNEFLPLQINNYLSTLTIVLSAARWRLANWRGAQQPCQVDSALRRLDSLADIDIDNRYTNRHC